MTRFYSNGKLLLTGEYVVLDGANALALPTNFGQSLSIETNNSNTIIWKSYNELNEIWFEDEIFIAEKSDDFVLTSQKNNEISVRLIQILKAVRELNPEFLKSQKGFSIKTEQNFNRLWGLGTSSTLINNIADWAKVDAYQLLKLTFGGSGYDIACAKAKTNITYQLLDDNNRKINNVNFKPNFRDKLYFVYLNQKKNSRDGIAQYKNHCSNKSTVISEITKITEAMITCNTFKDFTLLIDKHEELISKIIKQKTLKAELFNDFKGSIKSLGAWGGDFILVASEENPIRYFKAKGFDVIVPYSEMIKY